MAKRKQAQAAKGRAAGRKTAAKRGTGARKSATRSTRAAKASPVKRKTAARASKKTKAARRKTAARAVAPRSKQPAPPQPKSRLASVATRVRGAVAGAVALVAGSWPWSAAENDPIALLETDHRRFEQLMKQGEDTTERAVQGRTDLLNTLTAQLNVHELIEEKVLYPALKPHAESRAIVLEGYQEHHVADVLVRELHNLAKDDERWGAKFKVLAESLEHHIAEEERKMFPTARQVLTRDELQQLGARMRAMRAEVQGSQT